MTIITINKTDAQKVETVKEEMLVLGNPTIRAINMGDNVWVAVEGSHRIVAASELGMDVEIEEIEYSDNTITVQIGGFDEEVVVISELVDAIYATANRDSEIIKF